MSDYLNNTSGNEIDDILAQVRNSNQTTEEEPSRTWSLDDIDRLIAQSNGEEYVPAPKKAPTPAEDFERILSREFDTGIFTVRPMAETAPKPEMQDISSTSGEDEVDGQETFFDGSEEEEFDEAMFEIETVIVPEDIPKPHAMFAWQETEKEPEKPEEKGPSEIKMFYDDETTVIDIFTQKQEEKKEPENKIDYRTRFFEKLKLENTVKEANGKDNIINSILSELVMDFIIDNAVITELQ